MGKVGGVRKNIVNKFFEEGGAGPWREGQGQLQWFIIDKFFGSGRWVRAIESQGVSSH